MPIFNAVPPLERANLSGSFWRVTRVNLLTNPGSKWEEITQLPIEARSSFIHRLLWITWWMHIESKDSSSLLISSSSIRASESGIVLIFSSSSPGVVVFWRFLSPTFASVVFEKKIEALSHHIQIEISLLIDLFLSPNKHCQNPHVLS